MPRDALSGAGMPFLRQEQCLGLTYKNELAIVAPAIKTQETELTVETISLPVLRRVCREINMPCLRVAKVTSSTSNAVDDGLTAP